MDSESFTTSESGHRIPSYGTQPEKAGLYLALFHGRLRPDEEMDDWGFNGPLIGPLKWIHTTYALHLRLMFINAADEEIYFRELVHPDAQDLFIADDMIVYGEKYYGDWSAFFVSEVETRKPPDTFRKEARRDIQYRVDIKRKAQG